MSKEPGMGSAAVDRMRKRPARKTRAEMPIQASRPEDTHSGRGVRSWTSDEASSTVGPEVFRCGSVLVDLGAHVAWLTGGPMGIRPREERLLALLWQDANRVVSTQSLVESLYGNLAPESGRIRLRRLVADIRHRFGADLRTRIRTATSLGLILYAEPTQPAYEPTPLPKHRIVHE